MVRVMLLPKPKSAPGLVLYGTLAFAATMLARVAWVLVGQNVESLSAEQGYDRLLSRHWAQIMRWFADNNYWLGLVTAFALGGAIFSWFYAFLSERLTAQKVGEVQASAETEIEAARQDRLDRVALAEEAESLASEIGKIISEYRTSDQRSRNTMNRMNDQHFSIRDDFRSAYRSQQELLTDARATLESRMAAQDLESRIWLLVAKARKCISLDRGDVWMAENASFINGAENYFHFLVKLAVQLRYPIDDIPMNDSALEARRSSSITGQCESSETQ